MRGHRHQHRRKHIRAEQREREDTRRAVRHQSAQIEGTETVGSQLTCEPEEWGGEPSPSFEYEWLRDGEPIELATDKTYTVQLADVRSSLACTVTATNEHGQASDSSIAVTVPATAAFTVTDAQEIKGSGSGFVKTELKVPTGQTVDYRITVRNTGNLGISLTHFLDSGCVNVVGPGSADLAPAEVTTYSCEHAAPASGTFTNEAVVEAETTEGDESVPKVTSNELTAAVSNAPIALTEGASELLQRTATVNAMVDPDGKAVTACKFEYGTTSLKSSANCLKLPGAGSVAVAVSAHLAGLAPHTIYHFRISATSAAGTGHGAEGSFETLPATPPSVVTEGATSVLTTSAVLNAMVNPNGGPITLCQFEYGTTKLTLKAACSKSPGSGTSAVAVSALVKGLVANTIYHFRIVATSLSGTTKGSELTVKTS